MGSFVTENEDLVPDDDKYYFGIATVRGLREQLRDNNLAVSGLKYELYRRLVENGIRLYNDGRNDDIEDEDEENDESDDEDERSLDVDDSVFQDSESEDSEADYIEGNELEGDISDEENSEEEESESGDGQSGDDQEGDDQRGDPPRRSNRKRDRDNDDDGGGNPDGDNDPDAPPYRRRRIGIALPIELMAIIIESLNAPGVWNLIDSAPEEYLGGNVNALTLEARYQYRLDYPPPPPSEDRYGVKKIKRPVENPWPASGSERPLSLLEWVARRATLDVRFRTTNRTRIMRVLDAYLEVYGMADPPGYNVVTPTPNMREGILYYFRNRTDLLVVNQTPLMRAAQNQNPFAVELLIMRGANVNRAINGVTALELAGAAGFQMLANNLDSMQTAYALLGAGADVTVLGGPSRVQAMVALQLLMQGARIPQPGQERANDFPRVDNTLGQTIRQFIADERSHPFARMLLTLYAVHYRNIDFPRFI